MDKLNDLLHQLGISKVKLAKFLGVSRQMIYNYLELDSINKWPKDKKVLLLNLLGVKSSEEIDNLKITTDYIYEVDERLNSVSKEESTTDYNLFEGLGKKQKVLLQDVIELLKEKIMDENNMDGYYTLLYLYHYLQTIPTNKELKYILAYVSKSSGFTKPMDFVFNEDEQFNFESILFTAFNLYNGKGASKSKLAIAHERFVNEIEHKMEEKMGRTMELNKLRDQALRELGYTEINAENSIEIYEKIAELESRKCAN